MPDTDLHDVLRQRFLAAAADHPHLQAVLYAGRHNAFPPQMMRGSHTEVTWPLARLRMLPPVDTHIATFAEPPPGCVEILAFFGDEAAMRTLTQLSRAAIDATDGWKPPVGHKLTTAKRPAAAWVRSLFSRVQVHRYFVSWHKRKPMETAAGSIGTKDCDPLTDPVFDTLKRRGHRPFGCSAVEFTRSVFAISAAAIGGPVPEFLGVSVSIAEQKVSRGHQVVELTSSKRCWSLFYHLWRAGSSGVSRPELMKAMWPKLVVTDNALDQVKRKLNAYLEPLGLEVCSDRIVWRLGFLAQRSENT